MLIKLRTKSSLLVTNFIKLCNIGLSLSQHKPKQVFMFPSQYRNITHRQIYSYSFININQVFKDKQIQNLLSTNERELSQLSKKNGQQSFQYVQKLLSTAIEYALGHNIKQKQHIINKKAEQYLLKAWKILETQPSFMKEQDIGKNLLMYLIQFSIANFYYKLQFLDQSKHWYCLFRKKIEQANNVEQQLLKHLNQFPFKTYYTLATLYLITKQPEEAKKCYEIFLNLMKTQQINIERSQQLLPIRDYIFLQFQNDKNQGLKAMEDLIQLANCKVQQQAQLLFTTHTYYVKVGKPLLAINLLQKIIKQIQSINGNLPSNDLYTSCLWYCTELSRENKQYSRQYDCIKKTISAIFLADNMPHKEFILTYHLVQKSAVQANLGLLQQSYSTLNQAFNKTKQIKVLPAQYSPQAYDMILTSASQTFLNKKLQQKYVNLLSQIIEQINIIKIINRNDQLQIILYKFTIKDLFQNKNCCFFL